MTETKHVSRKVSEGKSKPFQGSKAPVFEAPLKWNIVIIRMEGLISGLIINFVPKLDCCDGIMGNDRTARNRSGIMVFE